jgi:integrase
MLKHPETISYQQIQNTINNLTGTTQELAATAYATGSRVSELNQIKKSDIQINPNNKNYLTINCIVLKKNRKNKTRRTHERQALVRVDETWLTTPILNRANSLTNPDDLLFNLSRATIWRKLTQGVIINGVQINPHGFRHLRATHLRKYFSFDSYQLQKFFGWSSIAPSSFYVGLDTKEIEYPSMIGVQDLMEESK